MKSDAEAVDLLAGHIHDRFVSSRWVLALDGDGVHVVDVESHGPDLLVLVLDDGRRFGVAVGALDRVPPPPAVPA